MELTIRPEDLRPGVTLVDVLALLRHGADAAAAARADLSPADLASPTEDSAQAPLEAPEANPATPASPPSPAPAATPVSALSPAPPGSAPSPATAEEGQLPQRAELIGLARTALQGGRRDAVKTLLERAGVKRMSEIPDETLTDAIDELKDLLS